ncbi:hypothetical protein N7520_009781 [Penicillium odoratum]|uniref:uncharacterized protein n=1 Tax=Penicillium odoratum TaxID=1167516 RepID=UPI0025467E53|nr:uncharacterized protein N7520_009781 [Penicillium odoratum]KAJ5752864.1 hypothetical protein N7520_009781 [Penicillium odoratum]
MDVHSFSAEAAGHIFNEKLPESTLAGTGSSNTTPTHLTIDTYTSNLRSSTSNSPATATHTPNTQNTGELARFQNPNLRTLPAWIRSVEEVREDNEEATATDRLLPSQPNDVLVAQHNHAPHPTSRIDYTQEGQLEEGMSTPPRRESRWKTFSRTIQYPREFGEEYKEVTPEWMNENMGNYLEPWRGNLLEGDSPEFPLHNTTRRREIWFKRIHAFFLRSPIAPLVLRLTVWCFSLAALVLGGIIQHMSDEVHQRRQGASALMAIIVDAVALVYLIYITFDEYTAKPLGLRSPTAKARLILLDLFFIVFDSANLSLAFNSLSEVTGACTEAEINQRVDPRNDRICERQKALASVLLVALVAWLMTFAISVLRLVERVRH